MKLIGETSIGSLIVELSQAEFDALKPVEPPIQGDTAVSRFIIPVPHINQNSDGSRQYRNDCGMACVAMAIHTLTGKRPSVDHLVMHYIQEEYRGKYLTFSQLRPALRSFGLQSEYKRPFKTEDIQAAVEAGWPCIVLVKYPALPKHLQAISYQGSHFVLISGYENGAFLMNDPLAAEGKWIEAIDLHTAMSGFGVGENLPYQGMAIRKNG
ncbi:MAG: C39 family peptidase [Candidatus Hydrogenedentes bacterium]|nr:C39 family peptidase [Candidatus Hydrogenedentota bacterium]